MSIDIEQLCLFAGQELSSFSREARVTATVGTGM